MTTRCILVNEPTHESLGQATDHDPSRDGRYESRIRPGRSDNRTRSGRTIRQHEERHCEFYKAYDQAYVHPVYKVEEHCVCAECGAALDMYIKAYREAALSLLRYANAQLESDDYPFGPLRDFHVTLARSYDRSLNEDEIPAVFNAIENVKVKCGNCWDSFGPMSFP